MVIHEGEDVMLRMEIACLMVVLFLSKVYFSAKRERTTLSAVFSVFMLISCVHLFLESVTVYTVNHLHKIPLWINNILHRFFFLTMLLLFYLLFCYIAFLIEDETGKRTPVPRWCSKVLLIAFAGVIFLPIHYKETTQGNYSYGPSVYAIYVSVAVNVFMSVRLFRVNWKQIHKKKRSAISLAIAIFIGVSVYQVIRPIALISGMGIMLINLSLYLTMEDPDIFLIKQIEEEKKKADEANQAKSMFLSNMSHEIRTPMNAIVGMTEILLRTDLTAEQKDYLINIKHSGNALVTIINDILDISKIEAGKMELVEDVYETRPVMDDIYMLIKTRIGEKPIDLLVDVDKNVPEFLYGDEGRIRQIMINLLNNAVKFTEKGYVKITVKAQPAENERIAIFISVSDTGQGIRKEDINRLFQAFEQVDTKKNKGKEGTGLGLTISSQLISMMGGKLEVTSEYGKGSEFYFTIYQKLASGEMQNRVEKNEKIMNFTAPDAEILLVDDNEINRKVAIGLLAPLQMNIDTAEDGKKAIYMLQKKKYDLVFMDHLMPVMDGIEATIELRKSDNEYMKKVPIIALSANAMKEAQDQFKEAGMNGFVAKPIDMKQISRVIRQWLPKELVFEWEEEVVVSALENATQLHYEGTEELPQIEGIDVAEGIKNIGSLESLKSLLGDYYKTIEMKSVKIEKYLADGMIKEYTIEVHALKSTSRLIGAMDLSERFRQLEEWGKENNEEELIKHTPEVLARYREYKNILEPYGRTMESDKKEADIEEICMYLQGIQEAIAGFDLDTADRAMAELEKCALPQKCIPMMEELRVLIADVAMAEIGVLTKKMIEVLKE